MTADVTDRGLNDRRLPDLGPSAAGGLREITQCVRAHPFASVG